MSEQASQGPCCALCGSKEEETEKLVSCESCFQVWNFPLRHIVAYVCTLLLLQISYSVYGQTTSSASMPSMYSLLFKLSVCTQKTIFIYAYSFG